MTPRRFVPVLTLVGALGFSCLAAGSPPVRADTTSTGTPTLTPTVLVATEPTLTATSVPAAAATSTPRPRPGPTREVTTLGSKPHKSATPKAKHAAATPTTGSAHTKKPHHRAKHKTKPQPTATATPVLELNAEDSISPVTCNGSGKPVAKHPFLIAPYHGWTSIASYFDHDLPDFSQDGLVVTATGALAEPDAAHQASGFPAYWNATQRQFIYYDGHNGYDYNLDYQPVYAASAGKVIFARFEYPDARDHGYGQMVMIDHRNGYVTLYGHLSKIIVKLHEKVRSGQKIGISGNTGHSTGPHLHFTVFHNCTPTDPYGWAGSGADPLAQYKGQSSVFIWKRAPLIENPAPGWPGLEQLPAAPSERIVLLRLPTVSEGTGPFTRLLLDEANQFRSSIASTGATVKLDLLRGAVDVTGAVTPSTIYSLSQVASIAAPSTLEGEKQDVLAALARASLADRVSRRPVLNARGWVGYLMRWQGQALLLGKGRKGERVSLRLSAGRGGSWRRVEADPSTGSYALDLGHLTAKQFAQLRSDLLAGRKHGRRVDIRPEHAASASAARSSTGVIPYGELGLVLLLVCAATAALIWSFRPGLAEPAEQPSADDSQ